MYKRIIGFVLIISMISIARITVFGHSTILDVSYDPCRPSTYSASGHYETATEDGDEEWWYDLTPDNNLQWHIGHEVKTIRYYFADSYNGYTWTTDVSEDVANQIKQSFENSMQKWSNIYYYSYNNDGSITANQIAQFEMGDPNNYNVVIYPTNIISSYADTGIINNVDASNSPTYSETINSVKHEHYDKWEIRVNVPMFVSGGDAIEARERVGQHEMGHILGLFDLDSEKGCNHTLPDNHHQESLMGYGSNAITRATYKDIAGVSITRGFHTDNDHLWMLRTNDDGTKDVICALCNGVRKNISLTDGAYEGQTPKELGSCNDEHSVTGANMLLVATDGTRDFYKCLRCRYIAEVDHSHRYTEHKSIDDNTHQISCVCGESYNEGHTLVYGEADLSTQHTVSCFCGYEKTSNHAYTILEQYSSTYHKRTCECGEYKLYVHTYTNCRSLTSEKHISTCSCGESKIENHDFSEYEYISQTQHVNACADCGTKGANTEPHVVRASEIMGNRATCLECGRMINLDSGIAEIIQNIAKVSVNGSYILTNGVVVLVDEDVEAYLNGTLVFYDKDDVPVTQ